MFIETLQMILVYALYLILPVSLTAFFVVSLVKFILAKKKNQKAPGCISAEVMKIRKMSLIVSSVLFGLCIAVIVTLAIIIRIAIAYM